MGRVFNKFSSIHYTNESSVEQKFIFPFLIEFLGYKPNNIMTQESYNVMKSFPINRDKEMQIEYLKAEGKPDYLVFDDLRKLCFIIDAKHPEEDISNYKNQFHAYCSAYEKNIIVAIFSYSNSLFICF